MKKFCFYRILSIASIAFLPSLGHGLGQVTYRLNILSADRFLPPPKTSLPAAPAGVKHAGFDVPFPELGNDSAVVLHVYAVKRKNGAHRVENRI